MIRYSLISPTFGRPDEVVEFLESLRALQYPADALEVILADGTPDDSLRPALQAVLATLPMAHTVLYERGLPVSDARNRAAEAARGEYLLFFDSDCLVPPGHLQALDRALEVHRWDAFGGPDAAAPSFSVLQKAISYAMTSRLTTGGIRGNVRSTDRFYPRGFNMGFNAQVFKALHGYDESFKCGEDIELSIRAVEAGYRVGLIPEISVMHKRRATLGQFHRQVTRFGAARIALAQKHPGQLKATHLFPAVFALLLPFSVLLAVLGYPVVAYGVLAYLGAIFVDASRQGLPVGFWAVAATVAMHTGYGKGFLQAAWRSVVSR
jgi:GT2 family glycosyltransferase